MNGTMPYPPLCSEQVALSQQLTLQAEHKTPSTNVPGECAKFQRIGFTAVLGIDRAWEAGPDAMTVLAIMKARGKVLDLGTRAEVGDLLVWAHGHGVHGHISCRVLGNRVAQNSLWNYNRTGDPRGFEPLENLDPHYFVIRLWQP